MVRDPEAALPDQRVRLAHSLREQLVAGAGALLGCPKANDRVYDAIAAFRTRYRDNDIPPERPVDAAGLASNAANREAKLSKTAIATPRRR